MSEGQRAAEILHQAKRQLGVAPQWRTAQAASYTDADGDVEVILDGLDTSSGADDDEDLGANTACFARVLCGPVAMDERVATVTTPDGGLYVVGSMGGQPRCVGLAAIAGGAADVAVASTLPIGIDDLRAEYTVAQPNHLFRFDTSIYLQSGGAANTLIGRIRREDPDATTVEVGRFLRSTGLANNETVMAGVSVFDVAPDTGVYTAWPSVQASVTGWSIILNPSTTPLWAASLAVMDCGPLPPGVALV